MAIEYRPSGEAQAVAQAGRTIGAGERAKEERSRAERKQQRSLEAQARDAAKAWEWQKFILNSQQDFAHEQRMRQAQLDAEARAKEWEVEKMQLASQFDFEQDEKERLKRKATYVAGKEAIDNNEGLTDQQKEIAHFLLSSKYTDIPEAATGLGYKPQSGRQGLFDFGLGETPNLSPTGTPNPTVNNPLGLNVENVPISQLPQVVLNLEAQSKFEVISPDGDKETIDADQWPDYKARGYILAAINKLQKQSQERRETEKVVSGILAGGGGI
jgi:hypothetical protein